MSVNQNVKYFALGSKEVGKMTFDMRLKEPGEVYERDGKLYTIDQKQWISCSDPNYFYEGCDMALIFFSIGDPDSFKAVDKKFAPEVRRHGKRMPIILVGTKLDLRLDEVNNLRLKNQKPVTTVEGFAMAKRIGAVSYFETSSLIKETFPPVAQEILRVYTDPPLRNSIKQASSCNIS